MASKREPIPVDFGDGIPRQLRLTITATRKIQERFGSIDEMMKQKTMDILPDCLFAALVDKDGITPDKIADIIELADVTPLFHTFLHAMTRVDVAAQIKEKEAKEAEEKAALEAGSEGPNEQIQPTAE